MNGARLPGSRLAPWAGLLGGAAAWYAAHDASFYALRASSCAAAPWVVAGIHAMALLVVLGAGALSYRSVRPEQWRTGPTFEGVIGLGAALLFAVVIIWQGAAVLFYSGCDR
jgi:hypothetical protein